VVLGATGVSGRALVGELGRAGDWRIIGVSRRPPDFETAAEFVSADLFDPESCRTILGSLEGVTHVFWTAYADRPTIAETREPNTQMFVNAVGAIEATNAIEHICICQGTKYYGQYLGPFKTPAKETDGRVPVPHFYYDQEDFTLALQKGKSWTWSAARPHVICGYARGNPLNVVSVIAVYANIMKALGLPLTFPGKPGAFSSLYQATHAPLLGRAMIWMATDPGCANQAFNITNGDFFRYQNIWPSIAAYFGMEPGGVEQMDLEAFMADKAPVWQSLVERHGLKPYPFETVADWHFANYAFSNDWDVMSDTTKCRKHGFFEFIDSEEMFRHEFDILRRERIIPA
jgi:nucleoside-diphosphate-sugar epimerase